MSSTACTRWRPWTPRMWRSGGWSQLQVPHYRGAAATHMRGMHMQPHACRLAACLPCWQHHHSQYSESRWVQAPRAGRVHSHCMSQYIFVPNACWLEGSIHPTAGLSFLFDGCSFMGGLHEEQCSVHGVLLKVCCLLRCMQQFQQEPVLECAALRLQPRAHQQRGRRLHQCILAAVRAA